VGAGNSYGRPTSATRGRLAQVGWAVYRTDLNGDVTVTTDGTTYDVKTGLASSQPVMDTAKIVTTQQPGVPRVQPERSATARPTGMIVRIFPGMIQLRLAMTIVNRQARVTFINWMEI